MKNDPSGFDVVIGLDMETDIGSFTDRYEGVQKGTPRLLEVLGRHEAKATFFWTGHAAENNANIVRLVRRAGHETGCHGLFHETLGDPLFPLPNNWPVLPEEVFGRIERGSRIVRRVSGVQPRSFRCPRLWGSTAVVNTLERLGYVADASLPLYFYRSRLEPYHPSSRNWTRKGRMRLLEIPNFCDLAMKSRDRWQRDRDQWPMFRIEGAAALLAKAQSFITYVRNRRARPVLCFYFHPWEFHKMPKGDIHFGEGSIRPVQIFVQNCGGKALAEFDHLCAGLTEMGGRFCTAAKLATEY